MPRMWTNPYYTNGDDNDRQRPPSASEPGVVDPHAGGGVVGGGGGGVYHPHQHHLPHHGGLPPGHLERAHSSGSVPPGYHPASYMMQGSYPPPSHPDPRFAYPPPHHHGGHAYAPNPRYEGGGGGAASVGVIGATHHGGYIVRPTSEDYAHHHSEDEDDDEDEEEQVIRHKNPPSTIPSKEPRIATSDDEEDDDDDDEEDEPKLNGSNKPAPTQGRGKPEAMAIALAAVNAETTREELAATYADPMEVEVVAEESTLAPDVSSGPPATAPKPKSRPAKKKPTTPTKKKVNKPTTATSGEEPRTELLLDEEPKPIAPEEYENLGALMKQFCRVPLLAEFSRPVSLLHPEVSRCTSNFHRILLNIFLLFGYRKSLPFLPSYLISSWQRVMKKSSSIQLTWATFAEESAGDSTKIHEMSASICGAFLLIASSSTRIRTTRKLFQRLCRLPCIYANISTACGKNTCCLRNYPVMRRR